MGILFDTGVHMPVDIFSLDYETKKTMNIVAPQRTDIRLFAPTTSLDYNFNPQYMIGSPHASMSSKKGGSTTSPSFAIIPTQTVSPGQSDMLDASPDMSDAGGGSGMFGDLVALGAIAIIGVVILGYVTKRKKGRDVKVSAVGK